MANIKSTDHPPPPSIYVADGGSNYNTQKAQRSRNVTGWDQKFKIQRFQNMIMLHIKLNEIANAATRKHIFCPYTHPRPIGCGQMHKNKLLLFSESSHVAYQIRKEWSIEHHASAYSILAHTLDPWGGVKAQSIFF